MSNSLGFVQPFSINKKELEKNAPQTIANASIHTIFIWGHIVSGTLLSFVIPLAFFSIIFIPITDTIKIFGTDCLVLLLVSPWLCAIFAPLFLPITWPEAVEKKLIRPIESDNIKKYERFFWFLKSSAYFNISIFRHLILAVYLNFLFVPIAIGILFAFPSEIKTFYFIVFASFYIACISLLTIPICILAFSIKPNHERVMFYMTNDENRMYKKVLVRLQYLMVC